MTARASMMKGKRRLGQHLKLGDRGDQDRFPDQQYNNGTNGSKKHPKGKGEGKSGKGGRAKVERAKGLGPNFVCWIHILDGKTHLWNTSSQIGAPTRTWFPLAAFPRHFPWKPVRGPRNCTSGSSLSRLLWKRHQKLERDPSQYRTGSMS